MEYTIKLTKDEVQALAGLIDAGLRATGIRAAKVSAILVDKLEAAMQDGVIRVEKVEPAPCPPSQ